MNKRKPQRKKVKCPICGLPMYEKLLKIHLKNIHPTVHKVYPKKPLESRSVSLDESGFITNPSWEDRDTGSLSRRLNKKDAPLPHIVKKSDDFEKVRKHVVHRVNEARKEKIIQKKEKLYKKEEVHRREETQNKIKIPQYKTVNCPICNHLSLYKILYDHILIAHPNVNPKIEMAKLNKTIRMSLANKSRNKAGKA